MEVNNSPEMPGYESLANLNFECNSPIVRLGSAVFKSITIGLIKALNSIYFQERLHNKLICSILYERSYPLPLT